MNKSIVLLVALAFTLVAVAGCSPEGDSVEPTIDSGDESSPESMAEVTIDANVIAEDDTVELGELV